MLCTSGSSQCVRARIQYDISWCGPFPQDRDHREGEEERERGAAHVTMFWGAWVPKLRARAWVPKLSAER